METHGLIVRLRYSYLNPIYTSDIDNKHEFQVTLLQDLMKSIDKSIDKSVISSEAPHIDAMHQ